MEKNGNNFTFLDLGFFKDLDQYSFDHKKLLKKVSGKKFLKQDLQLTSMEVSINKFPPGISMPFSHKHRENEELYIVIKGHGEFCVDNEWFSVQEGSVIRVSPAGIRTWKSSISSELLFIVIQAKEGSMNESLIDDGIRV